MPSYRFFLVGKDEHYLNVHVFDCGDDGEAIEQGWHYVDGLDVEIWDRARLVKRLSTKATLGAGVSTRSTPAMRDIPPSNL
jgi:hypothetical protein